MMDHSVGQYVNDNAYTDTIESVWSVFKRRIIGLIILFLSRIYKKYVDKMTFRLNESRCEVRGVDRIK